MDLEQLQKRIEWLDEERRKDKAALADLQKKLTQLTGAQEKQTAEFKKLSSEVTRATVQVNRVEEFDQALQLVRKEVKTELEAQEKRAKRRETDVKKRQDTELESVTKSLANFKEQADRVAKFREELLTQREQATKLEREVNELSTRLADQQAKDAEAGRQVRAIQEDQRAETKRLADLQGEVAALRKRADENRARLDLVTDGQKKTETRISELNAAENERRESQTSFIDRMTATQAERERAWREWTKRFDEVERQSNELALLIQNVGDTERAVKRAQEKFEEITDQINRRINEITEMQRLGEERFRQEWATFRADDQKRWTNYLLTQEELQKETARQLERLSGQSTDLEDNLQELRDLTQHLAEQSQRQLQSLLGLYRDWVTENQEFSGG